MPNHTTGRQDDIVALAEKHSDIITELVDIIRSLDDQLTDEKDRANNLEGDLRQARADVARLERELGEYA